MGRVVILRICIAVILNVSVVLSQQCRSYGKQDGNCVGLSRCPPLLAIILSEEKTPKDILMLQQLTCREDHNDPAVCCPISEIVSSSYIPDPQEFFKTSTVPPVLVVTPVTTTSNPSQFGNRRRIPGQGQFKPGGTTGRPLGQQVSPAEQILLKKKFEAVMPPLANCSQSDVVGGRIIGGKEAEHGQYPWMARLGYIHLKTGKVEYYCGGVVINRRYILTAAHCTFGFDESFKLHHVRLGEHNTKELADCSVELNSCSIPENFGVEKVITHPEYDTNSKHNDIALIRLSRDIGFQTYFIKPVCLPFFKEYGIEEPKSFERLSALVAGWGRTNWTRSEGSTILQHVRLPIVTSEKCTRDFKNRVNITPEQLCAGGEKNQDSCGGDSGGPLMVDTVIGKKGPLEIKKKFQYGIVSFGPVKCGIGVPGVYTRVSEYLNWILKSVEP